LPFASEQLTAPEAGSIAKVTMTVLPTATPAAGVLTVIEEPLVSFALVPTFLTRATAASALRLAHANDKTINAPIAMRPYRQTPSPRHESGDMGWRKGARHMPSKAPHLSHRALLVCLRPCKMRADAPDEPERR
jgi:hypothetical protein